MLKKNLLCLLACQLSIMLLMAQPAQLTWDDFRRIVLQNHPAVQQADMLRASASAALLTAKGGFDLKSFADYNAKHFNQKQYFTLFESGVKLPTWLGAEVKAGYQYADGYYLNPENTLPAAGQAYFGFNWSLGQGLITDERRTALFTARTGIQMAEAERNSALADLFYDAAKTYWSWQFAGNQVVVLEAATTQAQNRHVALVESFRQGEKPAVDTVETWIQWQNRLTDLDFARIDLQNAALALRNFIWENNNRNDNTPLLFTAPGTDQMVAPPLPNADELVQQALPQHPDLVYYRSKATQLNYEQRLKNEKRKPVLDVSYNILGSGWQFFESPTPSGPGVFGSNSKWGVNFSYPITNRKARGDWQATQIKIRQNDLQLLQKRVEVENKIRQYVNNHNNLTQQSARYLSITDSYKKLLDAEIEKFANGESSVFLVNTREQRWLDAQLKWLKLVAELRKAEAAVYWAMGQWR